VSVLAFEGEKRRRDEKSFEEVAIPFENVKKG